MCTDFRRSCNAKTLGSTTGPRLSFVISQLVWYYYSRLYTKKSPKWQNFYTGPFEVTCILPPSNAIIQRSNRAKPFVVHFEKLRKCYEVPFTSNEGKPAISERGSLAEHEHPTGIGGRQSTSQVTRVGVESSLRPRRSARRPRPFCDFV